MHSLCSCRKHANEHRERFTRYGRKFDAPAADAKTKMVICAMDYKATPDPLSSTIDGDNMAMLVQACGVTDLKVLTDKQQPLTKQMAFDAIRETLLSCSDGDTFLFYYSGHGMNLQDADGANGDESDGEDEAYCFQTPNGQIEYESCCSDDEFATLLTEVIPDGVNLIIISDCCHSDTICDFSKSSWEGINAISISGCADNQTSGDFGAGGIVTHSMLLAIDKLRQARAEGKLDEDDYSVGFLYNATLRQKQKFFGDIAVQQMCIESSDSVPHDGIRWPLIPQVEYLAPLHKGVSGAEEFPPGVLETLNENDNLAIFEDDDLTFR